MPAEHARTPWSRPRTAPSGPTSGIDPKGILRAAFSNARGNCTQGASTITQQYVKILYLTQERSLKRKLKEAFLSLKIQREQSKEQILEGYLNTIYFGRGAYGIAGGLAGLLRHPRQGPQPASRRPCSPASSTTPPTSTRPTARTPRTLLRSATPTCSAAWPRPATSTPTRPTRPPEAAEVPQDQGREPVRRPEGPHAHAGPQRAARSSATRTRRSTAAACGSPPRSPPRRWTRPRRACWTQKPEGFGDKELHVAAATVEPRHRRPARLLRRPGLPRLPDQLGRGRRHGRLDVQAVHAGRRRSREGFSLKDTFQGNSPYDVPRRPGGQQRGRNGGNDYGASVTALFATEQSINTAYVDMSASIPDGPDKILETANELGIPPTSRTRRTPASRDQPRPRGGRADHAGQGPVSPINMANAYATFANGGVRANVHVIKKVDGPHRRGPLRLQGGRQPRRSTRTSPPTSSYALQQVVQDGTGPGRARPRPPGRRQDRHRHQRQGPGLLGVVRRLHAPAGDGGDVRPRRRRRPARRLAAVVLRRRLPGPHLDRDHAAGHGGHGRSRSSRRRPTSTARRRPTATSRRRPPPPTAADEEAVAHQDADDRAADDHRPSRRRADQGPDGDPDAEPTPTLDAVEPTPTVTPSPTATAPPSPTPVQPTTAATQRREPAPSLARRATAPGCPDARPRPRARRRARSVADPRRPGGPRPQRGRRRAARRAHAGRHPWWTPVRVRPRPDRPLLRARHGQGRALLPPAVERRQRQLHAHVLLRPALPLHRPRASPS